MVAISIIIGILAGIIGGVLVSFLLLAAMHNWKVAQRSK